MKIVFKEVGMSQRMWAPWMALVAMGIMLAASHTVSAQNAALPDEYSKRIQQRSAVPEFRGDMFGDQISLNGGSLELVQNDIDLPGNSALPVQMGCRLSPESVSVQTNGGHLGAWDMDIPSVHGVFSRTMAGTFVKFADSVRLRSVNLG